MQKFIDSYIKSLKPKNKRYLVREDAPRGEGGFAIRIMPSGKKSWFMIYSYDGTRKWLFLGDYPNLSLSKAREKFRQMKILLAEGKDPGDEIRTAAKERRDALSVNTLCDEFLEKYCRTNKRPNSARQDELNLNRDIRKHWGKRKARDITRSDVISLIDDIMARGAKVQANRTLATVRKMFSWALKRDIVELNPASNLDKPYRESPRDRHLSDEEIKALWEALSTPGKVPPPIQNILKLMLLTGNRAGELVKAKREQLKEDWLEIPREDSKNDIACKIYISDFAKNFVSQNDDGYLIDRVGLKKLEVYTVSAWVRRHNHFGLSPWTPHDLRRTCITKLAELDTPPHIVERATNHKVQGVTAKVYDQFQYLSQIREALGTWSTKLQVIIAK